jgi:outer membrane protein assembly factor BamA
MLYKISLTILFISLFVQQIKGFNSDTLDVDDNTFIKVDSIEIRGNETTEDFVIMRELTFKNGDEISGKILSYNKERIYSLGLFNFVKLFAEKNDSVIVIVINVDESWYIYPIPFLSVRDKDLKQTSYGMSLLYRNFRGRNETIQAVASFGYDKFYYLSYLNPLLIESQGIIFSSSILYQTPVNKSRKAEIIHGGSFDYTVASGAFSFGKRLNQFNDVYLISGYNYVEAPEINFKGITASDGNIDRGMMMGMMYVYDTRDLKQFPTNGIYSKFDFLHKDLPLIPKNLTSARIAFHLNLFYDAGITYNKIEQLSMNNFDSGFGAGITILVLPYNAIRFEYAFNNKGKGEFLIGSGFSF